MTVSNCIAWTKSNETYEKKNPISGPTIAELDSRSSRCRRMARDF